MNWEELKLEKTADHKKGKDFRSWMKFFLGYLVPLKTLWIDRLFICSCGIPEISLSCVFIQNIRRLVCYKQGQRVRKRTIQENQAQ